MIKHEYNLQTFYNEDYISYYLLGAFMADGCVHEVKNTKKLTTTISSKDLDWLTEINNYICPKRKLLKKGTNCHEAMYNCTPLGKWLISKGCVPKKSLIMDFPDIPKEFLPDFIRGCWDGDGTVSFNKSENNGANYNRQVYLTSGSELFCNKMTLKLAELGIKSKVVQHNNSERKIEGRTLKPSKAWRVRLWGEEAYNFCKIIYGNNPTLYMNRKYIIAQNMINEWENVFCEDCKIQLPHSNGKLKRCEDCSKQRAREQHRKYYAQKIRDSGKVYYLDAPSNSKLESAWIKNRKIG